MARSANLANSESEVAGQALSPTSLTLLVKTSMGDMATMPQAIIGLLLGLLLGNMMLLLDRLLGTMTLLQGLLPLNMTLLLGLLLLDMMLLLDRLLGIMMLLLDRLLGTMTPLQGLLPLNMTLLLGLLLGNMTLLPSLHLTGRLFRKDGFLISTRVPSDGLITTQRQEQLNSRWTPHFDYRYQRWFYLNQEAEIVQWEAPGYDNLETHPEPFPSHDSRGGGSSPNPSVAAHGQMSGGYSAPPGPPHSASYSSPPVLPTGYGVSSGSGQYSGYDGENHGREEKQKKSSGNSGLLLGAAGGVAAGLVGGALLHHALEDDSSDEERERPHYVPPPPVIVDEYRNEYSYNDDLPTRDAEGNYVSESDRESVEEARERYEEALHDVEDSSSPSSSDYEELEEAREEYEEEYEETYDD
ncbi:hypothetical protein TASIC1_0008030100 [Trichoderma asperellum]|uniref:WW domain-containing protein n=1 Tax=Trichoderma asperellum TaxID=101201 RepID=A0A6V8QYR3_TRIAP|nr:hypothetical protein TASIC1_0008030100 [Trichoderma asperellum]